VTFIIQQQDLRSAAKSIEGTTDAALQAAGADRN
jgi:hypothetical protein